MENVLGNNAFRLLSKLSMQPITFDERSVRKEVLRQHHEEPDKFYVDLYDFESAIDSAPVVITTLICEKDDPCGSFLRELKDFAKNYDGKRYVSESLLGVTCEECNRESCPLYQDAAKKYKDAGQLFEESLEKAVAYFEKISLQAKLYPDAAENLLRSCFERDAWFLLESMQYIDEQETPPPSDLIKKLDEERRKWLKKLLELLKKSHPQFSMGEITHRYKAGDWGWYSCPDCKTYAGPGVVFPVGDEYFCANCQSTLSQVEKHVNKAFWDMGPEMVLAYFAAYAKNQDGHSEGGASC